MSMRIRLALLTAIALCATAFGQPPVPPPPRAVQPIPLADETQIVCEVRLITLRADLPDRCELTCPTKQGEVAFLTDAAVSKLLDAAQGDPRTNVMMAPRITLLDGENAQVKVCDTRLVTTGVRVSRLDGKLALKPEMTPVEIGHKLTLCGTASADRKQIRVAVSHTETTLDDHPAKLTLSNWITPVFEGGSQGHPVPCTEIVEMPKVVRRTIDKSVTVPNGGHFVIAGATQEQVAATCEKVPVLGELPVVGDLFTSTRTETHTLHTLLIVSPKIIAGETAPAPLAARQIADGVRTVSTPAAPKVYQLRNAAAQDVAHVVNQYAEHKNLNIRVSFDAPSNSIHYFGDLSQQQEVCKILEKLDAPLPQVVVQVLVAKVKAGFAEEIGLTDKVGESAWTLTPRELRLMNAASRASMERNEIDILSRPQLVVQDNQTGFVQVGEKGIGLTARVTPRIGPDGKTVLLRLETQFSEAAPMPVNLGAAPRTPALNEQAIRTTVELTMGNTFVVRGAKSKQADGTETEVLMLVTVQVPLKQ